MRYKIGDKVRIKTWEDLEKEYGLNEDGDINCNVLFPIGMEEELNKISSDRIVEIFEIDNNHYYMGNFGYMWIDEMIEGLAKELKIIDIEERIISRFEILDL